MKFTRLFLIVIVLLQFAPCLLAQAATTYQHGDSIQSVVFSPTNHSLVASGSDDNTIKLWNIDSNTATTLTGHTEKVNSVAFSPNGQTLASGSNDVTVKLWNVSQGTLITSFIPILDDEGVASVVNSVAFSPDGNTFATAGYKSVRLWNVSDQTEAATLEHADWVHEVVFSKDGKLLAAVDGRQIKIWDVDDKTVNTTLQADANWVGAIAFSPNSSTFAAGGSEGQITLWSVSGWTVLGRISASHSVSDLAFSPNGATLASAGDGVELWSVSSGRKTSSFTEHNGWVMEVAFSSDGNSIASGGLDDGMLNAEDVDSLESEVEPDIVRLIYFLPSDRTAQSDIDSKIDTLMKATQTAYADQMEEHGYGRKTFTLETDSNGDAVVHHITGNYTDSYYETNSKWRVWDEIREQFDVSKNISVAVMDLSSEILDGVNCGTGGHWDHGGVVNLVASGNCFEGDYGVTIAVHEIGHAFGLAHDYRNHPDKSIDLAVEDPMVTSACAAEWLDGHRYFNSGLSFYNEPTTISMSSPSISGSDVIISFTITDPDGLHQAKFFDLVQETDYAGTPYDDLAVLACTSLSGSSATATFTTSALTSDTNSVAIRVIDDHGNMVEQKFSVNLSSLSQDSSGQVKLEDVNGDGVVDILDLVAIANNFGQGQQEQNRADVNGDGAVNILDLGLVAGALGTDPAAPSTWYHDRESAPTRAEVQQWLREARRVNLTDPAFQRGILMLEQLLASLTPKETTLFPNYPNPFNPETWIPYQLAESLDVSIAIYAADGKLVRTLELGHQPLGIYESRSRAAYWDGRNELGERVASGIYFYTLTAGNSIATRKMLIRK